MSTVERRALLGVGIASGALAAMGARAQTGDPTGPQPKLPTQPLSIATADGKIHRFKVEVAQTPREQQIGLMYRTVIPADSGMLFVWAEPQVSQMWMEHCPVPEDMVFIGTDGAIASIAENTVPESLAIVSSVQRVAATLELQGGLTAKLGISIGDKVSSKALMIG